MPPESPRPLTPKELDELERLRKEQNPDKYGPSQERSRIYKYDDFPEEDRSHDPGNNPKQERGVTILQFNPEDIDKEKPSN